MRKLTLLFLMLFTLRAFPAVERITLTITTTNVPVTGDALTVNSSTRTWTNADSSATILTNLVGVNAATTNLYNHIASHAFTGPIVLRWLDTNQISLVGTLGGALAASSAGTWATLTLSTQSGPVTYTAQWPIENLPTATNRTNQASSLVYGLSTFTTNAFATNSTALSNHITKGASPEQVISSTLKVTGTLKATSAIIATNGFISAVSNISPITIDLVNYGNAIRSEGIGGNSLQLGSNAVAAGLRSVAIGNGAYATNDESTAIGYGAIATNKAVAVGTTAVAGQNGLALGRQASALYVSSTSLGNGAVSIGGNSVAIGNAAEAGTNAIALGKSSVGDAESSIVIGTSAGVDPAAINSIVIGASASATHSNAVVIGNSAVSTTTNEIVLGSTADRVHVAGIIEGAVSTNATFKGTNIISGRVDFTARANSGLANGNNAGIVLGTNVYVQLSGPSAAYVLNGFAAEQNGSFHILELDNPAISITVANSSGTDPTAANRIITGTGGDVVITNDPAFLQVIYNSTASRWRVISYSR